MEILKLNQKDKDDIVESLTNLLKDANEGKLEAIAYLVVNTDKKFNYGWHGSKNRFELAGQLMWLANAVLHESFLKED